jgi:iron complex transport system substrate-binding protein
MPRSSKRFDPMSSSPRTIAIKDVEAALHAWSGRSVEIVSLKPNSLADIWEDIAEVAHALGLERQGERLVKQLKARMASIAKPSGAARTRPRGAMIEWIDPLMAGANSMPELGAGRRGFEGK